MAKAKCDTDEMGEMRMGRSMKLGGGGRFAAIEKKAAASGARNPAAVAAAAGIRKYGKAKMAKMAAAGRKRKKG